jgi:hypothetical protein
MLRSTTKPKPHLPTQGTENCRVDVARLVLPATAKVTTSFWRHASAPTAVYQEEEMCITARYQVDTEYFTLLVLATSTMAECALDQHVVVRSTGPFHAALLPI